MRCFAVFGLWNRRNSCFLSCFFFGFLFSLLCICWNSLSAVSFDGNVFHCNFKGILVSFRLLFLLSPRPANIRDLNSQFDFFLYCLIAAVCFDLVRGQVNEWEKRTNLRKRMVNTVHFKYPYERLLIWCHGCISCFYSYFICVEFSNHPWSS